MKTFILNIKSKKLRINKMSMPEKYQLFFFLIKTIVARYQADDLEYGKDPFSAFILKVYRLEHVYTVNIGQCPMGMVLKELCGSFSVMNPVSQM